MVILAGLGNPDEEYRETRHNLGFKIVLALAKKLGHNFEVDANTYRANQYLKTKAGETDLVLTLPLGYMNNSGHALRQIMDFFGDNETKDLWVVHDDTEIPFGEVRIKFAGSSAGHNGVKSIDDTITNKYWRIRVGVGRPKNSEHDLSDYVLAAFGKDERGHLPAIIDQTASYLLESLGKGNLEAITFNAKEK